MSEQNYYRIGIFSVFFFFVFLFFMISLVFGGFGFVSTGNVGVRETLKQISEEEISPGFYFKWPLISSVREVTAKEVEIPLVNMTPKAKDNLSLRDLDVSVYYKASPSKIADIDIKYQGQTSFSEYVNEKGEVIEGDVLAPAYNLVRSVAREAVYSAVSGMDSLTLHQNRDALANKIRDVLQANLDATDKGVFTITRVVVRQALTDPSIEEAIREAVANQKKLEAMQVQARIAEEEAKIEVTRAKGIADAQRIIANTLTDAYLTHERNEALKKAAEKGTLNTFVVTDKVSPLIQMK